MPQSHVEEQHRRGSKGGLGGLQAERIITLTSHCFSAWASSGGSPQALQPVEELLQAALPRFNLEYLLKATSVCSRVLLHPQPRVELQPQPKVELQQQPGESSLEASCLLPVWFPLLARVRDVLRTVGAEREGASKSLALAADTMVVILADQGSGRRGEALMPGGAFPDLLEITEQVGLPLRAAFSNH